MTALGLALRQGDHAIRLKWHKLRDRPDRAPHDRDGLALGLARGALLEVDVQLTGDDHWVCLHDATLDAETTGSGPVTGASRFAIEKLRQRHQDGMPRDTPPIFLDELTERLAASPAAGRVQLDLKLDSRSLTGLARARFGAVIAPLADRFDIGGPDWQAVSELASLARGSRPGFDPSELLPDRCLADQAAAGAFAAAMLRAAPGATMLYLQHGLITRAAALGVDLVGIAHANGREVDCWTVDPGSAELEPLIRHLFETRCDQLTTNGPQALEAWWQRRAIPKAS